ncbi:MAG: TetR/AcrR family transcriptional regulator [Anaerolineae bacterium]|nr:TetR/AcrR family transcriptional regulator [Anaerolineae bacterium]MDQ7035598.1 TetR/AcrR family transcriptional regulator [Anaerolineae bacterium]
MARKPADQAVHRDDIIKAAADVLREHGYDATTMKDIAARVNLTAASLYHHFKNKDFLLLAVLERGLSLTIATIEPIQQSDKPARDKLSAMIAAHINAITSHPASGAAMVFEIKALMNVNTAARGNGDSSEFTKRRDAFFEQRDYFEAMFRETVKEGISNGEFRPVDAAIVAKAMLGAHNWVGVWYKASGRLAGDEIAAIMIDTFVTALKK